MSESNKPLLDWIEHSPMFERITQIVPNHYVLALLVLAASLVLAKIMDLVVVPVIRRWSRLTETTFDDELIGILRRPMFMSIILIGLGVTADILEFDEPVSRVTLAILKTIAIFIWTLFIARFLRLILLYLSDDGSRYQIVQERTLPLLNNLSVILVIGLATYFMFVTWRIGRYCLVGIRGNYRYSHKLRRQGHPGELVCRRIYCCRRTVQYWRFYCARQRRTRHGDPNRYTEYPVTDSRRRRDYGTQRSYGQCKNYQ